MSSLLGIIAIADGYLERWSRHTMIPSYPLTRFPDYMTCEYKKPCSLFNPYLPLRIYFSPRLKSARTQTSSAMDSFFAIFNLSDSSLESSQGSSPSSPVKNDRREDLGVYRLHDPTLLTLTYVHFGSFKSNVRLDRQP
ncbi:hypothetical protein PNOK_0259700 [Pyrrhoderma noxium]|uniref:Uncharacterized protein n=1 Tax=Pyrrhoderma noxium TaxID=2282107 RepID=A0A286UST1_9AGAM|nr:hypothetical protein PNOK_0259700 [Pyrrhoderma noxium]